ncbi:MAG TPA: hypothetical protein VF173_35130 [Thermoanaerobaculia bacterium]|nr:hypothetical protein [Thermoanaerobaculia bacterium]
MRTLFVGMALCILMALDPKAGLAAAASKKPVHKTAAQGISSAKVPRGIRLRWNAMVKSSPVPDEKQLIEWKTTGADVESRLATDCYGSDWKGEHLCVLSTPAYGGWVADFGDEVKETYPAVLYFFDGAFYQALIEISPDQFTNVEDILIKALGKPKERSKSKIKNRMGAEFDQEVRGWSFPEVEVHLLKRAAYVDKGLLAISFKPIAKLAEEKKTKAEAPF